MRLLVSSASIIIFLNILQDQQQFSEVAAMNVTDNSSVDLGGDNATNSSNEEESSGQTCNCSCSSKEERSLTVGGGLGLAAGTAILIFAFSNTVIISATLVITYILYQVLITAVAVLAPDLALVMAKFLAVFSF